MQPERERYELLAELVERNDLEETLKKDLVLPSADRSIRQWSLKILGARRPRWLAKMAISGRYSRRYLLTMGILHRVDEDSPLSLCAIYPARMLFNAVEMASAGKRSPEVITPSIIAEVFRQSIIPILVWRLLGKTGRDSKWGTEWATTAKPWAN